MLYETTQLMDVLLVVSYRGEKMLDLNAISELINIFLDYQYIMTTAELQSEKLYYADIQLMLREGLIEKIKRGYYHWVEDTIGSEVLIINRLFPNAVLCMETALFYYRYSDRNPAQWNFALNKNVSKERTRLIILL